METNFFRTMFTLALLQWRDSFLSIDLKFLTQNDRNAIEITQCCTRTQTHTGQVPTATEVVIASLVLSD